MLSPIYADLKGFPPTFCMTSTRSKKKTKNATAAPTTKARVAKRSAKAAPLRAEPAPKAAGAKKPVTAPRGGSKTDKILDLLK